MVDADKFAKELDLIELSPSTNKEWNIESAEFNRPGIELVGFYEHFAYNRPQVLGNVEMTYIDSLNSEEREKALRRFSHTQYPALLYAGAMFRRKSFCNLQGKIM